MSPYNRWYPFLANFSWPRVCSLDRVTRKQGKRNVPLVSEDVRGGRKLAWRAQERLCGSWGYHGACVETKYLYQNNENGINYTKKTTNNFLKTTHPYVARAAYNYKTESAYKTRPYKKLSYKKLKQYHRLETVTSGSGKVSFVDPLMRIWQKCKMRASVISWHTFGGSGKRMFPFVDMAHWCIWYRDKLFDARATEMQIACDPNNTKNKNNFATSARYLSCVPFDFLLTIRNGS